MKSCPSHKFYITTSNKKGIFESGRMDMAESVIMTSRSELPRIVDGAFFRK